MKDNPFDLLGIDRDLVKLLYRQRGLDDFLKYYVIKAQKYIHPDMNGDHRLSAEINGAYDEICRNPSQVGYWIDTMRESSTRILETRVQELLSKTQKQSREIERLRVVESEYQNLKLKYDSLLVKSNPAIVPPRISHDEEEPTSGYKDYILMPMTSTYPLGVEALQKELIRLKSTIHPTFVKSDGSKIYRPLTFKEDIKARVENYELRIDPVTKRERSEAERLFLITERWLDSCTAMVYKAGTTKFKIIPQSSDLICIPAGFRESFMRVEYSRYKEPELDSSKNKYNTALTKGEVLNHPAWITAVEEDRSLLAEYTNIIFNALKSKYGRETGMGFYVRERPETDQLRALCVVNLNFNSNANGVDNLDKFGSFLLVAHRGGK